MRTGRHHDGEREGDGPARAWLKLSEGWGLDRDYVTSLRGLLPATRFAGRGLCACRARESRSKPCLLAHRTVLPVIISERLDGMLQGL